MQCVHVRYQHFNNFRFADNTAVRKSQIAKLEALKAKRDPAAVQEALNKLIDAARTQSNEMDVNLLKLAVNAARARATLGEISSALESVWGRHVPSSQVVQGAYSASYNSKLAKSGTADAVAQTEWEKEYKQVLDQVEQFSVKHGRRPRILVS